MPSMPTTDPADEATALAHPGTATVDVLTTGYVGDRVAGTVSLVRDGDVVLVIDPGMVADRRRILDPLAAARLDPEGVTDIVFSHHHPDHTLNAALFRNARVHDHWAIYHDDVWEDRNAEGAMLSRSVRLIRTPGHTAEDITTVASTPTGVVAFTHAWWTAQGPAEDPLAADLDALHASRARILALPNLALVVPGHGPAFAPGPGTPR